MRIIRRKAWRAGCLAGLLAMGSLWLSAAEITKLQTEYMSRPIGIDVARPRFSWQISAEGYGARQTAYQLLIAESEEALAKGNYWYDSGRQESADAVHVSYQGEALRPTTRYHWKVRIWDEQGDCWESPMEWFETGWFGEVWQGAEWISSKAIDLSPYRSRFTLAYDFTLAPGSQEATFVLGGKSDKHYVSLSVTTSAKPTLVIAHVIDGKKTVDFSEPLPADFDPKQTHHVKVDVSGPHSYNMHIEVDGKPIKNSHLPKGGARRMGPWGAPDEYAFNVNTDTPDEPNSNNRLYQIGFDQAKGQTATFQHIQISESAWQTTLYADTETHRVTGDGQPHLWQPAGEVAAPMLRKIIQVKKPLRSARLYATARGIYECYLNGEKVGEDYLNPGWTDFRKRIMYNTFDVTSLLKEGENALGAMLGKGWFTDHMGFNAGWQDQYGIQPSFMAMLQLEYTDGSRERIVTDGSWRCYDHGPLLENSLFNGEDYDARREVDGWAEAGFDDAAWNPVARVEAPAETVILQGYVGLTIQNRLTLKAQSVKKVGDRNYIYDMGQNLAGVPRLLHLKGKAGQTVTVHFAEMLYPEVIPTDPVAPYTVEMYQQRKGELYRENYRSALSTDRYILKGDPAGESYEPRFTYHGFRYLSVEGLEEPLPLEDVQAVVLESVGEQGSWFQTSNADINRLFENAVWGQRGNFLAVPTDCPQRDERMGWTGDAQVFARAATYNMNIDPFYTRWLYTVRDDQTSRGAYGGYYPELGIPPAGATRSGNMACGGWMEVGIVVPWQMYQQYGDTGILETHYASMCQFMDFLERNANQYIQPIGGTGDWLAPVSTNTALTNTAYSAYAAQLMEQIALALGHQEDAARFTRFYTHIKQAFNETFVNEEGLTVIPAEMAAYRDPMMAFAAPTMQVEERKDSQGNVIVDTQTSYVLPLQFGLFNEANKPKAVEHLREAIRRSNYTLTTGFVGTPYICLVLSDNGHPEDAYRLFTQTEYPSWLFPVKQGATTFWERWNSYTVKNGFGPVSMNSFNHYAYGAIEEWMMSHCLGIQRDEQQPGYKHFFLQPEVGEQLDFAKGGFETMYGHIESSWEKQGKKVIYRITVPANTTATIQLTSPGKVSIRQGAAGVRSEHREGQKQIYEVVAGSYEFTCVE